MNNPTKIKQWQNRDWLKKHYFDEGLTFKEIGNLVGRTDKTIQYFFKKFGFHARPPAHSLKGSKCYKWKGGKIRDARGYVKVFHPAHHAYKGRGQLYVSEHILNMEKKLGRPLKHPEIVHHKNGIQDDNRTENLQLMASPLEHNTLEQNLGKFAKLILFSDLAPSLREKLQSLFQEFLSSIKER